jgi:hypothetical protein
MHGERGRAQLQVMLKPYLEVESHGVGRGGKEGNTTGALTIQR